MFQGAGPLLISQEYKLEKIAGENVATKNEPLTANCFSICYRYLLDGMNPSQVSNRDRSYVLQIVCLIGIEVLRNRAGHLGNFVHLDGFSCGERVGSCT